jgi:hypothetical protein
MGIVTHAMRYEDRNQRRKEKEQRYEAAQTASREANQREIDANEAQYKALPETLRSFYQQYSLASDEAPGSNAYGEEWRSAMQAGLRGARTANRLRQNALNARLGLAPEEVNSTTQANTAGLPGSSNTDQSALAYAAPPPPPPTAELDAGDQDISSDADKQTSESGLRSRQKALRQRSREA